MNKLKKLINNNKIIKNHKKSIKKLYENLIDLYFVNISNNDKIKNEINEIFNDNQLVYDYNNFIINIDNLFDEIYNQLLIINDYDNILKNLKSLKNKYR